MRRDMGQQRREAPRFCQIFSFFFFDSWFLISFLFLKTSSSSSSFFFLFQFHSASILYFKSINLKIRFFSFKKKKKVISPSLLRFEFNFLMFKMVFFFFLRMFQIMIQHGSRDNWKYIYLSKLDFMKLSGKSWNYISK